jgi:hypothetical protein
VVLISIRANLGRLTSLPDRLVPYKHTTRLQDGEQFDSSHDRGEPLGFTVGAGALLTHGSRGVPEDRIPYYVKLKRRRRLLLYRSMSEEARHVQ